MHISNDEVAIMREEFQMLMNQEQNQDKFNLKFLSEFESKVMNRVRLLEKKFYNESTDINTTIRNTKLHTTLSSATKISPIEP